MKLFFGSGKLSTDVIPLDIDHAKHSVGGMNGHIFRRFTHVIMCLIPILYYTKGDQLSDFFSLEPNQFVTYCLIILIFLEIIRLYFGIIIVGQREYEAKQVSAGLECGISFKDFNDFQKKDIIEVYNSKVTQRSI